MNNHIGVLPLVSLILIVLLAPLCFSSENDWPLGAYNLDTGPAALNPMDGASHSSSLTERATSETALWSMGAIRSVMFELRPHYFVTLPTTTIAREVKNASIATYPFSLEGVRSVRISVAGIGTVSDTALRFETSAFRAPLWDVTTSQFAFTTTLYLATPAYAGGKHVSVPDTTGVILVQPATATVINGTGEWESYVAGKSSGRFVADDIPDTTLWLKIRTVGRFE